MSHEAWLHTWLCFYSPKKAFTSCCSSDSSWSPDNTKRNSSYKIQCNISFIGRLERDSEVRRTNNDRGYAIATAFANMDFNSDDNPKITCYIGTNWVNKIKSLTFKRRIVRGFPLIKFTVVEKTRNRILQLAFWTLIQGHIWTFLV